MVSISAYVGGDLDQVRFAIYSDKNGEPDALLVQSAAANSATSMGWVTLPVPPTELNAGNYWLTLYLRSSNHSFRFSNTVANAGQRNKANQAINNGYLSAWGSSSTAASGARSIYATYEVLK